MFRAPSDLPCAASASCTAFTRQLYMVLCVMVAVFSRRICEPMRQRRDILMFAPREPMGRGTRRPLVGYVGSCMLISTFHDTFITNREKLKSRGSI